MPLNCPVKVKGFFFGRKEGRFGTPMELTKDELADPSTLNEEEIAEILPHLDSMVKWAGNVKTNALERALSGFRFPSYKLVEGKSSRKYTDESAVAKIVSEAGFNPFVKKLVGVKEMTRRLGKKRFEELLGGMIVRPGGKPELVPAQDERPELSK